MRTVFLLASSILLISLSSAFPADDFSGFSDFERIKKILPTEVTQAYSNLSGEEKQALKEVFRNHRNYRDEQEFIAALKQKSPALGVRAERMAVQLQRKVAALGDESREFVQNLQAIGRELYAEHLNGARIDQAQMRQIGMGVLSHFRSLSPYAQDELRQTFPEVFEFLARARSQGLRGIMQRMMMNGGGSFGK